MTRIIRWQFAFMFAATVIATAGCKPASTDHSQLTAGNEYSIAVTDQGFEPADLKVPAGQPVTLVITRKTDQTCATEVVFASLNQRFKLPLNQPVRVMLPASKGGTVSYECGMHMLGGKVVVQ